MHPQARRIWEFWFDDVIEHPELVDARSEFWFCPSPKLDAKIKQTFGADIKRAAAGQLDTWKNTARGYLVLILLLDQFPRNVYRGTAEAFAFDTLALDLCLAGLEEGIDYALTSIERVFFYTPMQHAEDASIQNLSLEKSEELCQIGARALQKYLQRNKEFVRQHKQIIDRFGRFPHRNLVLGRPSMPAERAYLEQGGATFGQRVSD